MNENDTIQINKSDAYFCAGYLTGFLSKASSSLCHDDRKMLERARDLLVTGIVPYEKTDQRRNHDEVGFQTTLTHMVHPCIKPTQQSG